MNPLDIPAFMDRRDGRNAHLNAGPTRTRKSRWKTPKRKKAKRKAPTRPSGAQVRALLDMGYTSASVSSMTAMSAGRLIDNNVSPHMRSK